MYRKLLAASLCAALLAACGEKEQPIAAPACADPAVLHSVRGNIQEIVRQEAVAFARNDSRQFVDADKIIAAGSQLDIALDNPQEEKSGSKTVCRADLKITIPQTILRTAETNSPLIYGSETLTQIIEKRIMGSNQTFSDGMLTRTLRYQPGSGGEAPSFEDNGLTLAAQTVSAALLPYGVKSILMIDGRPVSLEDALKTNSGSQPEAPPPAADPADILENNAASHAAVGLVPEGSAPEVLSPATPEPDNSPAYSDLEQAREQNRAADSEINNVWKKMDKTVQQGMRDEQLGWIESKTQSCNRAAAQADNSAQAEYLRLQCDTRMTRERVQYLRGYTIN